MADEGAGRRRRAASAGVLAKTGEASIPLSVVSTTGAACPPVAGQAVGSETKAAGAAPAPAVNQRDMLREALGCDHA